MLETREYLDKYHHLLRREDDTVFIKVDRDFFNEFGFQSNEKQLLDEGVALFCYLVFEKEVSCQIAQDLIAKWISYTSIEKAVDLLQILQKPIYV
jgi:hypothetical protein